uniref:Bulb-type lectin domain-containing protein n=1 Tax=Caenorhabditis tropicalis TaxID=1561998 RepID=A0A1I7TX37_9PELO
MRKPLVVILLILVTTIASRFVKKGVNAEIDDTFYKHETDLEQTEEAQYEVNSEEVPELPRMNSQTKWEMIRASGQDPTVRRRKNKQQRQQKVVLGRERRDLILAPWRITHVAPKNQQSLYRKKQWLCHLIHVQRNGLPQKASYLISDLFFGGPRTVTAALTNSRSGVTILFEGRTAYRFRWNRKHRRFQLAKNTPQELPRNITINPLSAFEWADGNQVVLSGEHFIIYDAYWNLATFTGHTRKYFPNLPRDLLGIVYNGAGETLLMYTKTNKLKVYNTKKFKVVQEYPLKLSEFVGCQSR